MRRLLLLPAILFAAPAWAADYPCVPLTKHTQMDVTVFPRVNRTFEQLDEHFGPATGKRLERYKLFRAPEEEEYYSKIFWIELIVAEFHAPCIEVAWTIEPAGQNPVDDLDFDGETNGVVRLKAFRSKNRDGSTFRSLSGHIALAADDDGRSEESETFRLLILDPHSGEVLWGRPEAQSSKASLRFRRGDGGSIYDSASMGDDALMVLCDIPRDDRELPEGDECSLSHLGEAENDVH